MPCRVSRRQMSRGGWSSGATARSRPPSPSRQAGEQGPYMTHPVTGCHATCPDRRCGGGSLTGLATSSTAMVTRFLCSVDSPEPRMPMMSSRIDDSSSRPITSCTPRSRTVGHGLSQRIENSTPPVDGQWSHSSCSHLDEGLLLLGADRGREPQPGTELQRLVDRRERRVDVLNTYIQPTSGSVSGTRPPPPLVGHTTRALADQRLSAHSVAACPAAHPPSARRIR